MSQENPALSVIVPVYRVMDCIGNTLKSVLAQSFRDFEIVLVDDGSPDRSIETAEEILRDSGVPYTVVRRENGGQGAARNSGFDAARGEWIYFLDADDVIQPFALALLLWAAEREQDAEFLFSDFQYVHDEDLFRPAPENRAYDCLDRNACLAGFLNRSVVPLVPGTLYKRDFLLKNGIRHPQLRWSEDQYFMWSVLGKLTKAVHVRAVTYNYYRHPGTIMNSTPLPRILDAYHAYEKLPEQMEDGAVRTFLLPRWVLGTLRAVAKRKDRAMWRETWRALEAKKHLKTLTRFPSFKVRLLARAGTVCEGLLFRALGRI